MASKRKGKKAKAKAVTKRPEGLTDEVKERLLVIRRVGGTLAIAADVLGMPESTLHDWIQGDDDFAEQWKSEFHRSSFEVLKAYATMAKASEKAAQHYLETRMPELFGGENHASINVNIT